MIGKKIVSYRLMSLALVLAAAGLLGACNSQPARDTASPYYRIPVGSTVEVMEPLPVRDGHTRVFLQAGEVKKLPRIDRYRPSCNFELRTLSQDPRTIVPDTFVVTRADQGREQIIQWQGIQTASVKNEFGGAYMTIRFYDFWLGSDRQPDVMRLTCRGAYEDLQDATYPTLEEIRHALGDKVRIQIP